MAHQRHIQGMIQSRMASESIIAWKINDTDREPIQAFTTGWIAALVAGACYGRCSAVLVSASLNLTSTSQLDNPPDPLRMPIQHFRTQQFDMD